MSNLSVRVRTAANQNIETKEYWLNKLSGETVKSCFPYDYNHNNNRINKENLTGGGLNESQPDDVKFRLEGKLFSRLREVSGGTDPVLFIVLVTGVAALLDKYNCSGNNTILLGMPIPKQEREAEYINQALVLKNRTDGNMSFKELLIQMRQTIVEAFQNQDYPVELLPEDLNIPLSEGDDFPLFDITILLENIHDKEYLRHIKHNMTFLFNRKEQYIEGIVRYNIRRYRKNSIQGVVSHLAALLQEVLYSLDRKLIEINILAEEEKERILYQFNNTRTAYEKDKTIHQLVEEQVNNSPDQTALVFGDRALTYRHLDEKANRMAGILRTKGVKADCIIGLLVERSPKMMVGILGILKAGAAYLPIDPGYPAGRVNYILQNSNTSILVTTRHPGAQVEGFTFSGEIINLAEQDLERKIGEDPGCCVLPTNLVYVTYTSGSTGKPKGVMIEHRNVVNFIKGMTSQIDFSPGRIILALTTISFDIFVLETLLPLIKRVKIIIANTMQQHDPNSLEALVLNHHVNMIQLTPSRLKFVIDRSWQLDWLNKTDSLLVGGEQFPVYLLEHLKREYQGKIYNLYGPTETTVWSTLKDLTRARTVNIGQPIANTRIYILGPYQRLQPVGVAGELCIGGDGVARGYLNAPELTAEKFVCNPHDNHVDGKRIYMTGDLARWLDNENIDFLGRGDYQVKIRGHRIELGEIESQLLRYEGIKEATVIAREDNPGDKYLCAYIVPRSHRFVEVSKLREVLAKQLPIYMIPSYVVQLEKLPLTPNQKIDRKALPEPGFLSRKKETYVAPGDEVEKKLVEIWSEVLGVEKEIVGIDDNFFEIGGHSLKATDVLAAIHKELNVVIPMGELFKIPKIKQLSSYIRNAKKDKFSTIDPVEKKEFYVVSSAQKRLYILQQMEMDSIRYNTPEVIELQEEPDREKLEVTFKKLIEKHESLRTSFDMIAGQPVQKVHECMNFNIQYIENDAPKTDTGKWPGKGKEFLDSMVEEIVRAFVIPFDLTQAPLLRVGLIKLPRTTSALDDHPSQQGREDKYLLMVDMHHIISDGISRGILVKDFLTQYGGEISPRLRIQYKDFSEWQKGMQQKEQDELKKQEAFWLKMFEGEIPVLNIMTDFPRPAIQSFLGDSLGFEMGRRETGGLKKIALEQGVTLYIVLLAIYNVIFHRIGGQEDILLGSPISGRRHLDLKEIIGMFVNTLVLRNHPHGEMSFKDFLGDVKKRTLEVFENQEYQFEALVEKLALKRDMSRNPLFDIAFTLEKIDEEFNMRAAEMMHLLHKQYKYDSRILKFDMALIALEAKENLFFIFQYCTKLFRKSTMERFVNYFRKAVESLIDHYDQKIADIEIISPEEKNKILYTFNHTKTGYYRDKTIPELFEDTVEKTPDHLAVVYENEQITYLELNQRANRLARLLRGRKVGADTIVAIIVDRSLEMMVGIFAVLKAGGAYLPINPQFPKNRIISMLEDCQVPVVLTKTPVIKKHSFTALQRFKTTSVTPTLTGLRPQIKNFDQLPIPDRSLVDYEKYNKGIGMAMAKNTIAMQATRGCPYKCVYCHKIWPKSHVPRSAENIFAEVQLYYGMGVKRFVFVDDIFNLNRDNSTRFFKLVVNSGMKIQIFFPNGLRGDLLTKEYLDLMFEAGTINVALALETASPRLQKLIGKNIDIRKLYENMEYICTRYPHIISELFTIHGFPTETEEEAMMTYDFIKRLKWLHLPHINVLKIFPNTDMARLAVENGIPMEAIINSENLAYHELPDTLPFNKNFTLKYQAEYLSEYFLLKERLLHVLPYQMKVLTEDELVQKYNSFLPTTINCFDDLLRVVGINRDQLGVQDCLDENSMAVPGLNKKMKDYFPVKKPSDNALKVMLLDLSQFFLGEVEMLYDVIEPPLGLMNLMTYLHQQMGSRVKGKIAKSRIDFVDYAELKAMLAEFKPDIIGIRTLTFFREFFHETVAKIRQWGFAAPIVAGGPYATSDYQRILQDGNVDVVVLGEGEITFSELIREVMKNGGRLPNEEEMKKIKGIAFVPGSRDIGKRRSRELFILDQCDGILSGGPGENLNHLNQSTDLAYTIFTSGSTGKPKGAMIEHRNVNNLLRGLQETVYKKYNGTLKVALVAPYQFDASVQQIFAALLQGHSLHIVPENTRIDGADMLRFYKKHSIDISDGTPVLVRLLTESKQEHSPGTANSPECAVKHFLIGGEALPRKLMERFFDRFKSSKVRVTNVYGPTECAVDSVSYAVSPENIRSPGKIPIGLPLPNHRLYILDKGNQLSPIGVPGELYISGEGVGRGYLNRVPLTNEKFTTTHLGHTGHGAAPSPLYRTGDLARWLPDGNVEFLGRLDHQVKIRGYRIELGEIESQLLKHHDIKDAVVVDQEDKTGDKYLCAYLVLERELAVSTLKQYLAKELQHYMIPSYFVYLDQIPLTPNGKVDRKKLSAIDAGNLDLKGYTAPKDEIQKKLAKIWGDVLGVNESKISIDADFFDLGGHSLKATIMTSGIHKVFDVKLPLAEVFKAPHIRGLADYIKEAGKDKYESIKLAEKKDYYPLSSAQKRLYIIQHLEEGNTEYNIPTMVILEGTVHREQLSHTCRGLIERHESLRTSFVMLDREAVQRVSVDVEFHIHYHEMKEHQVKEKIKNYIKPFELSRCPLMRMVLIKLEQRRYMLVLDMHHIITDGISMNVLVKDFMALYHGDELPLLKLHYKDFSQWQNALFTSPKFKSQEAHWLQVFRGKLPTLDIPTDYPRKDFRGHVGHTIKFIIGNQLTSRIRNLVSGTRTTLYMVLLAAYYILLAKYSDHDDIVIGSGISGRNHVDLQNIIGMFVNMIAMRNHPQENKAFSDFLQEVKKNALMAYENQDYPFDELVIKLGVERQAARHPIFDTEFTLQNIQDVSPSMMIQEIKIPDLVLKPYEYESAISNFDFSLNAVETDNTISMTIEYSTEIFKRETIAGMAEHYLEILEQVVQNKHIRIKDIKMSHRLSSGKSDFSRDDYF